MDTDTGCPFGVRLALGTIAVLPILLLSVIVLGYLDSLSGPQQSVLVNIIFGVNMLIMALLLARRNAGASCLNDIH